jgi:hypothetical protein
MVIQWSFNSFEAVGRMSSSVAPLRHCAVAPFFIFIQWSFIGTNSIATE